MEQLDQIPFTELFRTGEPREAVEEIRNALAFANLNAEDALFDEALHLAREGHLGRSRDRLRMLLALNPADGGAHLLLCKVFASQHKWAEAIAELDAAAACGRRMPPGLKEALIDARDQDSAPRAPRVVRTDAELKSLREEARRLRTENSRMERQTRELEHRSQVWSIATGVVTAVSALALLLIAFSWPGGDAVEEVAEAEEITSGALPAEAPAPELAAVDSAPEIPAAVEPPTARELPVREAPAADRQPVTSYTVTRGDTLWKIAGKVYGDKTRWQAIRDANKDVLGEDDALSVGMVLTIPREQS